MNPEIRILRLTSAEGILGGRDERAEVKATSCPQDGKLSLKADEPQVGQGHEDEGRKLENYLIIIFPERN